AQKEYQDKLNEAVKSSNSYAAEQITKVNVLNSTMTNGELPMGKRIEAYNELKKLAPKHLENLTQEEALTKGLADRINNDLVPAIMAAARARAYEQKIQIATERLIDLQEESTKLIRARSEAERKVTPEMRKQAKIANEIMEAQRGSSRGFGS